MYSILQSHYEVHILREGINPPSDGKMMTRPRQISMITLQASKSHSSRTPKSEPSTYETPHVHAPITPAQSTGTSSVPPGFQTAKQSYLIANVFHQISDLERLLHSFHNQTQMRLTTIETEAGRNPLAIRAKKGESSTRMRRNVHIERGSCVLTYIYTCLLVYGYSFMF